MNKGKIGNISSALIFTIFGLVLIIWPGMSTRIVCRGIGLIVLLYGVIQIIYCLQNQEKSFLRSGFLMLGILFALLGGWIVLNPNSVIKMIPILMGILIVLHGVQNIGHAIELKKNLFGQWGIALLLGLVTIILGAILIRNPFAAVNTLTQIIGIFLLFDGLSDLWIKTKL